MENAETDLGNNSNIRIAVLNGCGREGLATLFAKSLRNSGFDVVNGLGGNADSFDFEFSVVLDRKGNREKTRAVADVLGIDGVIDQYSTNPYIVEDVVVILGRDWDSLKILKGVFTD
ncbi:LytR C-terminal domain-containing protein [Candidatus Latescibacterota bacterium]